LTLAGGPTVLVELPFVGWPIFTEQVLFDVQAAGFRPLLAHPERYAGVQGDVSRALTLVERGVSLQVTIGSLAGLFGKRAQRVAEELLRQDAVHALATDAHTAGQRIETVVHGLERARTIVGPDRLHQLVVANPAAMLRGEPLPPAEPIRSTPDPEGGWFGALRRAGHRLRR
jgi:protein-tyrosine phosphatase